MQVNFSIPEFPQFKSNLGADDYRRYSEYVKRFENYAAFVVKAQVDIAGKAVEKGYMKEELAVLKGAITDINAAAVSCVESSTVMAESELRQVKEQIKLELDKLSDVDRSVAETPTAVQPIIVTGNGAGMRGANWERNVALREARKLRKAVRQEIGEDWRRPKKFGSSVQSSASSASAVRGAPSKDLRVDGGKTSGVKSKLADLSARVENAEDDEPPVGRVGRNGKPVKDESFGFWKSCDEETRKNLIESKARMHIASNELKMQEAVDRVNYLRSPHAAVSKAVKYCEFADRAAMQAGHSIVHDYARTVSSKSAESIVKSLPDSVTSFVSYEQKKIESELMTKLQEEVQKRNELEEMIVVERTERRKLAAMVNALKQQRSGRRVEARGTFVK